MINWESKNVFCVYKKIGETPFDVVKRLKEVYPELKNEKIAYAGRLDPMAEGVTLFIKGKELKNFDNYLKLDKEYEAEIIFGIKTDSYDMLGFPSMAEETKLKTEDVKQVFLSFKGDFSFAVPPFSSYKIKKKPLFWWTLNNKLNEVEIPRKNVCIYEIDFLDFYETDGLAVKNDVFNKVNKVRGDFRQKKIKERWEKSLEEKNSFQIAKIRVKSSSGFYVRSMADIVGEKLKTGGTLFSLKRSSVGEFDESDVIDL